MVRQPFRVVSQAVRAPRQAFRVASQRLRTVSQWLHTMSQTFRGTRQTVSADRGRAEKQDYRGRPSRPRSCMHQLSMSIICPSPASSAGRMGR